MQIYKIEYRLTTENSNTVSRTILVEANSYKAAKSQATRKAAYNEIVVSVTVNR